MMAHHDGKFEPTITLPQGRELKGGDLLAQTLRHLGAEVAFGLHGGHLDAFLMGAHDAGLRLVDTRHEAAAVQAAEGWHRARAGAPVGVCFVTANSGFCNGLAGLAAAAADRSALLCLTSSSPGRDAEANVLQGIHDQVVLAAPVTRFAHRVARAEEIPRLVAYAWRRAAASPPGPVLLDLPIEVLFAPVQWAAAAASPPAPPRGIPISWGSLGAPPAYPPGPHPEAVRRAARLLRDAERPVVVTGTGARGLRGGDDLLALVTALQAPVFASNKHSSPLPFGAALRCGSVSRLGALERLGLPQPDLVLILGARSGMFFGPRSDPPLPRPDVARYIQVDVDSAELGRMIPLDVGITSDVVAAVTALWDEIRRLGPTDPEPSAWSEKMLSLKTLPLPWEQEPEHTPSGKMHPYHALKTAFEALPSGAIITLDGGEAGLWANTLAEAARPREVTSATGYLGLLGNGWGYALGMSEADHECLVVNVQGDGSAGFHIAELDTYARLGRRVLTVVMNNHCWGMSMHGQELLYGGVTQARPTARLSPSMDFAAIAEGAGCTAAKVSAVPEIKAAVERLLEELGRGKPALLELIIDDKPTHPGTVDMVGNTNDENEVVVPYYDNIPRARYA